MELNKMLQYQKTDIIVYRLERDFNQSKERELLVRCKKAFEDKKNTLIALSKELDNVLSVIEKLTAKLDEVSDIDKWVDFDVNSIKDIATLDTLEKEFDDFDAKINEIAKELAKAIKREEEIAGENKIINEAMETLNNEYRHINGVLEKKKMEMVEKARPHILQLKALAPEIDKKLYEKYIDLRKNKKMPAIVVYNEGCCGGCGMDISIEVGKKLVASGDIAECPHCGRLVFKP